jgi:hypothetical protein
MLDVVVVTPPSVPATDVVSVNELAIHIRLSTYLRSNADWISRLTSAIEDAVDKLEGPGGELNRCIRQCTLKRYLKQFPTRGGQIQLPYPTLISVDNITVEDGSSPPNIVPVESYVVGGELVASISPVTSWPSASSGPRAVSVTYTAGYPSGEYPPKLKRMVKILAAHYLENPEATINEPRQMAVNRRVDFGMDDLRAALTVPYGYDNWDE